MKSESINLTRTQVINADPLGARYLFVNTEEKDQMFTEEFNFMMNMMLKNEVYTTKLAIEITRQVLVQMNNANQLQ
jgi:hypothetical protein